mmetsp:Transcript_5653/g.21388  ORF Transcript_5653/g.21388 Transcript_5653/m.21388 type:complete len:387 (+) Transcript_5653:277-1437(+)
MSCSSWLATRSRDCTRTSRIMSKCEASNSAVPLPALVLKTVCTSTSSSSSDSPPSREPKPSEPPEMERQGGGRHSMAIKSWQPTANLLETSNRRPAVLKATFAHTNCRFNCRMTCRCTARRLQGRSPGRLLLGTETVVRDNWESSMACICVTWRRRSDISWLLKLSTSCDNRTSSAEGAGRERRDEAEAANSCRGLGLCESGGDAEGGRGVSAPRRGRGRAACSLAASCAEATSLCNLSTCCLMISLSLKDSDEDSKSCCFKRSRSSALEAICRLKSCISWTASASEATCCFGGSLWLMASAKRSVSLAASLPASAEHESCAFRRSLSCMASAVLCSLRASCSFNWSLSLTASAASFLKASICFKVSCALISYARKLARASLETIV